MTVPPLSTKEHRMDGQSKDNQYSHFPVMSDMIQYDYSALQWISS